MSERRNLGSAYLRLRPDSRIEPLPVGDDFWPRLMSGQLGDFHHEYLVTTFTYEGNWQTWERHPAGDEVVCLLQGDATFVLDEGTPRHVRLHEPGDYLIVPRGTWHTATTATRSSLLFITAGEGTEHRPLAAGVAL